MKKHLFLFFFILLVGYFLCYGSAQTYAYDNPIMEVYGIGYSVDAGKSTFADPEGIKVGSPIFDETWLRNLPLNRIDINTSSVTVYSSTQYRDVAKKFSLRTGSKYTLDGAYDMFSFGLAYGFGSDFESTYELYYSQYYYYKFLEIKRYSLSMPNYSCDLSEYKQHLHPNFLNSIEKLRKGQMSYTQFINAYGTHVVGNAVFGGRLELFYSVLSNQVKYTTLVQKNIRDEISGSIVGLGSASSSVNFSFDSLEGFTNDGSTFLFRGKAIGGNPFDVTIQENYAVCYQNWLHSIVGQEVVIGYGQDGLIPIYDFVPDNPIYHNVKYGIQQAIINYLTQKTNEYSNIFNPGEAFDSTYTTVFKTISRNEPEYKITDSGRFKQKCDVIDIASEYGISLSILKLLGYNKISRIKITLDVKEEDDGYQYLFLYNGASDSSELLKEIKFEHGSGYKNKNYLTHTFYVYNINLSKLDDILVVRYGASGNWEDTWKNKNLKIEFTFSK